MPCPSPQNLQDAIEAHGARVDWTISHCDEGNRTVFNVVFTPANQGRKLSIAAKVKCEGEGAKSFTKRVVFHDNGYVEGYGDTRDGVSFQLKPFDRNRPHVLLPDAYLVP
ncbi:hypothetical protein STA1M1_19890 [Sinisalibacter aestuarii]|uniref:Uncharacterized protein n=1 Tax=Sinisalibacter aestuarii TaxID=2949426 RepID=A0ABQ5LUL2_9RHOB|nr:hypothetical protein STA1M1_19890 [Sinisalibacter aestuarii]